MCFKSRVKREGVIDGIEVVMTWLCCNVRDILTTAGFSWWVAWSPAEVGPN